MHPLTILFLLNKILNLVDAATCIFWCPVFLPTLKFRSTKHNLLNSYIAVKHKTTIKDHYFISTSESSKAIDQAVAYSELICVNALIKTSRSNGSVVPISTLQILVTIEYESYIKHPIYWDKYRQFH